jgi:hypothetical protein
MTRFARFFTVSLLLVAVAASAQDHPCENDTVRTRGGHKAYRKECCPQRPYTPHDLAGEHDRDQYLCAMGNSWACKPPGGR